MAYIASGATSCFRPYTLEQAVRGLVEAGFESVELCETGHPHDHLARKPFAAAIVRTQRLFDRYALRCSSLSARVNLTTWEGVGLAREVLIFGSQVGAEVLSVVPAWPENDLEMRAFHNGARVLADMAQAADVRLCCECRVLAIPNVSQRVRLLEEIGHDWIQLSFDPAEVALRSRPLVKQDITRGLARVGHMRITDRLSFLGSGDDGRADQTFEEIGEVVRWMATTNFKGPVSLRIAYPNDEWPSWETCVRSAMITRGRWEKLMGELWR